MNKHAQDMVKIIGSIILICLVVSTLLGLLILYLLSWSFWHGVYLIPLIIFLSIKLSFLWLRRTTSFPN